MHTTVAPTVTRRAAPPVWALGAAGAVGALVVVLTGATIGSNPRPHSYRWWLRLPDAGYALEHVAFYAGVALLTGAWLTLGIHARAGRLTSRRAWALLGAWGTPLFVGSPVFSRDVYSYVAEGQLLRHGLNPYLVAPRALGSGPLFDSIAQVWRDTTSPYGPLFVSLTHVGAWLGGRSLMGQVVSFRALELVGEALLMVGLPLLARHLGTEPGVALWLGVLSPLALFSAVSSAHNDTIMLGLLIAALALASRGARRRATVLIALAATVKLPALAGAAFVYAPLWRDATGRARARLAGEVLALSAAVIAAVTVLAGFGWTWLSPAALKIPTELRVLTTPVVSLGVLVAAGLHALGWHERTHAVVTVLQVAAEIAAAVLVAAFWVRAGARNWVTNLGLALLVVVALSPTVWPWYFLWGVSVLAVTARQSRTLLALLAGGAMLLVGPGGTPMIGGNGFYVSGSALVAATVWYLATGRWRSTLEARDRVV